VSRVRASLEKQKAQGQLRGKRRELEMAWMNIEKESE
jgi:hypothetical protein